MVGTKKKIIGFVIGLFIVSVFTVVATLAWWGNRLLPLLRNVIISDIAFTVLYVAWLKVNKGYENIYKSGFTLEDKK